MISFREKVVGHNLQFVIGQEYGTKIKGNVGYKFKRHQN